MNLNKSPNLNSLWASLTIEELVRSGADCFCISPGSRSSPLAFAVGQNPKATSFVHFDERGSAFFASGHVAATQRPAVVITTSGTAAANVFPAVIEASKKKLPLIILTADRPPELRHTGANQTIDQVKLYGEYVRFHFDMPCPTIDIHPEFILTTIDQAVYRARANIPGPVHINCMYREPLAPVRVKNNFTDYLQSIKAWLKENKPYTKYHKPAKTLSGPLISDISKVVQEISSGIIVVGKLAGEKEAEAVLKLSEKLRWPIFPDVTSSLRLGCPHPYVIPYFDHLLSRIKKGRVDGILHLGGRMTSKRYYEFIEKHKPRRYVMVIDHLLRNDPVHIVSDRVTMPAGEFCRALEERVVQRKEGLLLKELQKLNDKSGDRLDKFFSTQDRLNEPMVARLISQLIPKDSGLFIGNSLPIREMDMFADPRGSEIKITANRGASGIDGNIATAAGFSRGLKAPVTVLLGDTALLYDLNSLALLKDLQGPVVIVVLNNNGGGIFSFLPQSRSDQRIFERFFSAPHGLHFLRAAQFFGLNYSQPITQDEFTAVYERSFQQKNHTIIEVMTDRASNVLLHQRIKSILNKK